MLQGHLDEYTRIEVFLPFKSRAEVQAGLDVIDHLKNARGPGQRHRYVGMTYSAQWPPVFQGVWWDKKRRKWVLDRIVILTLDLDIPYGDRQAVTQEVNDLKQRTANFYQQTGAPQIDIWVITHAVGHIQS